MLRNDLKKGEIFIGRQSTHPIIFIESKNDDEFVGILLTHAHTKKSGSAVRMKVDHFEVFNSDGNKFPFQYDDELLPQKITIRKNDWGPFEKAGNLTAVGNAFIDDNLDDLEPLGWGQLGRKDYRS